MSNADSLDQPQSVPARLSVQIEHARSLRNSDPGKGIRIGLEALSAARSLVYDAPESEATRRLLGDALAALGHCERMSSALTDSAAHCAEAVAIYAGIGESRGQAIALTQWGIALVQLGDLTGGLAQLERSRDLSHALGDAQKESDALIDIGIVHNMLGDDASAISLYEQALPIYEGVGDTYHAATCLNNMAYAHVCWGQRERETNSNGANQHFMRASALAQRALPLARGCDHIDFVATCLNTLSQAQRHAGDVDACMATLQEQLEISGKLVGRRMEAVCRATMADALLERNRGSDLVEAVRLLHEADRLCVEHKLRESHPPILESLASALERSGDLQAALSVHRRFHAVQVAVNSEAAERDARTLESRLRLERTQADLEHARQREHELAALNTRLQEQQVELEKFAHIDALTGLANRRAWLNSLNAEWDVSRGLLYLLLLDIDRFKVVNDVHGHAVGDNVLVAVARCLQDILGDRGTCGRFGGEEFVAWARIDSRPSMAVLSEQLLGAVRGILWSDLAPNLRITASLGWCSADEHATIELALAEADRRMYEAKRAGGDQIAG